MASRGMTARIEGVQQSVNSRIHKSLETKSVDKSQIRKNKKLMEFVDFLEYIKKGESSYGKGKYILDFLE